MPNTNRPTISTHVLDTTRGEPAVGVGVILWRIDPTTGAATSSQTLLKTDAAGRISDLLGEPLELGLYRLQFDIAGYYRNSGDQRAFIERATFDLKIADATRSYHVPLLMTPFSCTTYRGS
jgi:5-hydroxyisourate hydrolase